MIDRLTGLKSRSSSMADYIRQTPEHNRRDIKKLAHDVGICANWVLLHDYYTIEEKRLVGAHTCKKHLLCPFCAVGRGARSIQKTLPKIESIVTKNPKLIPVMLTLTIKNGEDLNERHRHLVSSRKRLIEKRRNAAKGLAQTEMSKVHGAIYSDEFTFNDETGWHPHTHMIALLTDYIDQAKLSEEWKHITGDSFIVDVRKIQTLDKSGNTITIIDALGEVFKYAVKLSDMDEPHIWTAYKALTRKRLLGGFGSLHGVKLEESAVLDPYEDLPYIELLYRWKNQAYHLDTAKTPDGKPLTNSVESRS